MNDKRSNLILCPGLAFRLMVAMPNVDFSLDNTVFSPIHLQTFTSKYDSKVGTSQADMQFFILIFNIV